MVICKFHDSSCGLRVAGYELQVANMIGHPFFDNSKSQFVKSAKLKNLNVSGAFYLNLLKKIPVKLLFKNTSN